jgi:hypothetical protein
MEFSLDTLKADNYLLIFENADSFKRTDIYGDLDFRISLTDTLIRNFHIRARKIEAYLANHFGDYFYKTDSMLVLRLANGDSINFVTDKDEELTDGCIEYVFEHYFEQIDYYLLTVLYWEGNSWMLVNRKNGFQKLIHGLPYISKDNKKIITIDFDLVAGYNFNGIGLYIVLADSLQTEFHKATEWGPIDVKWINENEFLLKREHFSVGDEFFDYKRVRIEK